MKIKVSLSVAEVSASAEIEVPAITAGPADSPADLHTDEIASALHAAAAAFATLHSAIARELAPATP